MQLVVLTLWVTTQTETEAPSTLGRNWEIIHWEDSTPGRQYTGKSTVLKKPYTGKTVHWEDSIGRQHWGDGTGKTVHWENCTLGRLYWKNCTLGGLHGDTVHWKERTWRTVLGSLYWKDTTRKTILGRKPGKLLGRLYWEEYTGKTVH